MNTKQLRILEFFIVGLALGIGEDLLAITLSTDAVITPRVLGVAFFVALPFAIFSELVVDHPKFWNIFRRSEERR